MSFYRSTTQPIPFESRFLGRADFLVTVEDIVVVRCGCILYKDVFLMFNKQLEMKYRSSKWST